MEIKPLRIDLELTPKDIFGKIRIPRKLKKDLKKRTCKNDWLYIKWLLVNWNAGSIEVINYCIITSPYKRLNAWGEKLYIKGSIKKLPA